MKKRIRRLEATNAQSTEGDSSLCSDIFEIDIEEELKLIKEDEDYNTDLTNFNLKL